MMGEQKRREGQQTPFQRAMTALMRKLADEGKTIETGWIALRSIWIPPDAPDEQIKQLRYAYMAGAQHLWASLANMLEEGAEPTEADLRRLDLIHNELEAFRREVELETTQTKGSA